jgi:surfeit locus 1 family protein
MQNTLFSAIRPLSPTYSRAFKRTFLLSLSGLCFYGFYWQATRFQSSSKRWEKINESLSTFSPIAIEGINAVNYPWANGNVNEWEYKLVELKGYFKDERFFVRRTKDGRLGYLVFAPFVTAKQTLERVKRENVVNGEVEFSLFVNLGWVPLEHKKDIEMGNEPIPMLVRFLGVVFFYFFLISCL